MGKDLEEETAVVVWKVVQRRSRGRSNQAILMVWVECLRGRLLYVLGNFVRKGIRTFHAICCVVLYTVVLYKFISTLLDIMRFSSSDCWCPYHSVFRKLSRHSHTEHDQDEKIFVFSSLTASWPIQRRLFSPIRFSWSRRFIVFHRLFAIHAD